MRLQRLGEEQYAMPEETDKMLYFYDQLTLSFKKHKLCIHTFCKSAIPSLLTEPSAVKYL